MKEDIFLERFSRSKYLYTLVHMFPPKQEQNREICVFSQFKNVMGSFLRLALRGCRSRC